MIFDINSNIVDISYNDSNININYESQRINNLFNNDQIFNDFNNTEDGEFLIYIKPTCPYCQKAMSIMKENNLKFNIVNVNENQEKFKNIKEIMKVNTVPQIFYIIDGKSKNIQYIGGCDNFVEKMKDARFVNIIKNK